MPAIGSIANQAHSTAVAQPRLVAAAYEFEAQLMKELLRPMMTGMNLDGEESDSQQGAILGDFATEALGKALSARGGLGIATSILSSLSRNDTDSHAGKETAGSGKLQRAG